MLASELLSFHGMIGRSAAMQTLFEKIERVAPIDVPVLIVGETGTGKELVARALHRLSRRSQRPFETVNCAALTRDLLPSELFGHERGAFTGAVAQKEGLLGVADGGTVLLDEVGELPPDAQAALLRFVQEGELRAVGSTQTRRADVRILAATNRDIEAEVESGAFREDLFFRFRRAILEVPPLRARRDDVPLLVEHIRVQGNERYGLAVEGLTGQALAVLENFPWRGNVRELEAVVEEAMIFGAGGWLAAQDLNLAPFHFRRVVAGPIRAVDASGSTSVPLTWSQQEVLRIAAERQEVRRRDVMARCGVSREAARRELEVLVEAGLLQRVGWGRGARYIPGRDRGSSAPQFGA